MQRIGLVVGLLVGSGGSLAEPADRAASSQPATTQPAGEGSGWGRPDTLPQGGRRPMGDRPRGWGRGRLEEPGWLGLGPEGPSGEPIEGEKRPRSHRGGPDEGKLTPRDREELLRFVKDRFPEMFKRLERFQAADPDMYGRAVRRLALPMMRMMRVSRSNPELAETMIAEHKIEMALADLQWKYSARSTEADRERIRGEIRELVAKRFDLRHRRMELEIKAMQRRLDQAMARLSQQAARKAELVEVEARHLIASLEDRGAGKTKNDRMHGDGGHASPEGRPRGRN